MKCINCGNELPDNAKFCNACGAPQEQTANPQSTNNTPSANPVGVDDHIDPQSTPTTDSSEFSTSNQPQSTNTVPENTQNTYTPPTPAPGNSFSKTNQKKIIIISVIAAVVVICIVSVFAVVLNMDNITDTTTTKNAVTNSTTAESTTAEKETTKAETTESYNSSDWEKVSEDSDFYINDYTEYSYKMGAGTYIDKINLILKNIGMSEDAFTWAGDIDMGGYTRRVFCIGGMGQNVETTLGYAIDLIDDGDTSNIMMVHAFVGRKCDVDNPYEQLAFLTTLALCAYDELPEYKIDTVKSRIINGKGAFRYNNFFMIDASDNNSSCYELYITKSSSARLSEIERSVGLEIENYAY